MGKKELWREINKWGSENNFLCKKIRQIEREMEKRIDRFRKSHFRVSFLLFNGPMLSLQIQARRSYEVVQYKRNYSLSCTLHWCNQFKVSLSLSVMVLLPLDTVISLLVIQNLNLRFSFIMTAI